MKEGGKEGRKVFPPWSCSDAGEVGAQKAKGARIGKRREGRNERREGRKGGRKEGRKERRKEGRQDLGVTLDRIWVSQGGLV